MRWLLYQCDLNQILTPTSVDTCVSSSKDTVWGRKNVYEQVQNGEMGFLLFENNRPTFALAYLHLMFVL